jgi:hypothetical protein
MVQCDLINAPKEHLAPRMDDREEARRWRTKGMRQCVSAREW